MSGLDVILSYDTDLGSICHIHRRIFLAILMFRFIEILKPPTKGS